MQQTSATYQALIADPGARKEVRVTVAGVLYEQGQIVSLSTSACLFAEDTMSVGGAIAKEINLALVNPGTIPRMAEIIPSYRLVKGSQASEWIQKGIYYIDTRSTDELTGVLTIHGYDAMLRAEQVWEPDQSLTFPMTMRAAGQEIARLMGNYLSHSTGAPSTISQWAAVEALSGQQDTIEDMRKVFEERRNYIVRRMNTIPGVSCIMPEGAFYVMMNIEKLIGRTIGGVVIENDDVFAEAFLKQARVAVVPCSGFGIRNFVRWTYATSMDNIREGLDRLEKFLTE